MMLLEDVEESLVEKRLTSQYAKELGTVTLALTDDAVNLFQGQTLPASLAHPTTTASQIASLGDGNHIKGGKERFTFLLPLLKVAHI